MSGLIWLSMVSGTLIPHLGAESGYWSWQPCTRRKFGIPLLRKKVETDIGREGAAFATCPVPETGCVFLPWNGSPWSVAVLVSTKLQALGLLALETQHWVSYPTFLPPSGGSVDKVWRGGVSHCPQWAWTFPDKPLGEKGLLWILQNSLRAPCTCTVLQGIPLS